MANPASEHPNVKSYIRLLAKNGKEYFITNQEVYGPIGLTKLRLKWCVSMGYLESLKDPHYELILSASMRKLRNGSWGQSWRSCIPRRIQSGSNCYAGTLQSMTIGKYGWRHENRYAGKDNHSKEALAEASYAYVRNVC